MSLQTRLAAFISAVGADIKALYAMSGQHAHVRRSASANIPTDPAAGSFVAVSWDVEVKDVDDLHSASFQSRLTPKRAGPHVVNATLAITTSITSGFLDARLIVVKAAGGTEQIGVNTISNGSYVNVTGEYDFALGDYVECWIFNKTNGTQTLAGGPGTSQMTITTGKGVKGDKGDNGDVNALTETGKVRWTRAADGALIAEHVVATTAGADKAATLTETASAAGTGKGEILLQALGAVGSARVRLKNDPTATPKRVVNIEITDESGTVNQVKKMFASDGTSDYLMGDDSRLPSADQKAAMVGERVSQPSWNYGTDGYHPLPSNRNRYLAESDRRVLWWDIPAVGGGTVDFWPSDGYWLVKAVYGFHYDSNLVATMLLGCARATHDGVTRLASIRDQWSVGTNVSCTFAVLNNNTVNAVIRATSSHGNCRIIAQDMRGQYQF